MIAVIDYKAGNLKSVERALNHLGFTCRITNDSQRILNADRIIFPGVGAAGAAMEDLKRLGVDRILKQAFGEGKPILGICLGAQIVLDRSMENDTSCIGLVPGEVQRFPANLLSGNGERLKIPHMGWNGVHLRRSHPVLNGLGPSDEFYFVHSYYPAPSSPTDLIGLSEHGIEFASIIGTRNLIATQFHPEKSGIPGLRILRNFCMWDGKHDQ
jgi:glutamine amidotransferase